MNILVTGANGQLGREMQRLSAVYIQRIESSGFP